MSDLMALTQIGREALAVSTVSVPLVGVSGKRPTHMLIYVGTNPIRWRCDVDPTATAGMFVAAGGYIDFTNPLVNYAGMIAEIEFIRDTTATGDAALEIAYFN